MIYGNLNIPARRWLADLSITSRAININADLQEAAFIAEKNLLDAMSGGIINVLCGCILLTIVNYIGFRWK